MRPTRSTAYGRSKRFKNMVYTVAVAALALYTLYTCIATHAIENGEDTTRQTQVTQSSPSSDAEALLKVKSSNRLSEHMISYPGFEVSFNPDHHIPNYVAWELTAHETEGKEPRYDSFQNDPAVPGCPYPDDYRRSGFDRGHIAPAADMRWSRDAMIACFNLTNICPQANALNTGAWKKLEESCRRWARRDGELIIISGPVLTDRITQRIGASGVSVPSRFFKVILAPNANPPRAIGFVMNNGYVEGGMQAAAMSVDEVERITGYDFFSALPDDIENEVESQNQFTKWSHR